MSDVFEQYKNNMDLCLTALDGLIFVATQYASVIESARRDAMIDAQSCRGEALLAAIERVEASANLLDQARLAIPALLAKNKVGKSGIADL